MLNSRYGTGRRDRRFQIIPNQYQTFFAQFLSTIHVANLNSKTASQQHSWTSCHDELQIWHWKKRQKIPDQCTLFGPTLELSESYCWGNFWETWWSTDGLSWACRYHLELNWTDSIYPTPPTPLSWDLKTAMVIAVGPDDWVSISSRKQTTAQPLHQLPNPPTAQWDNENLLVLQA